MNDNRIRLDLKPAGKASITKTSVVAAVRMLENNNRFELLKSSQEIANWVTLHLTATYSNLEAPVVRICITWVEDPRTSVDGVVNPVHNIVGTVLVKDSTLQCTNRPIEGSTSEVLPVILAELIKDTPLVNIVEQNIDSFL